MVDRVEQYISTLDSARFGFPIAKLSPVDAARPDVLQQLAAAGVKLAIARVPTADVQAVNALEALGFRMKDVQVTHRFDLARFDGVVVQPSQGDIRDLRPSDVEQVVRVAAESFTGYGHYAADDRLDRTRCRDAYSDWARRSCEVPGLADKVIVAEREGTIGGFLTLKVFEQDGRRYAAGGIGAVSPAYRGHRVFAAIVSRGLQWGASIGLAWEEHNALVTNYPVNASFAGLGFRIADSTVTLHAWL